MKSSLNVSLRSFVFMAVASIVLALPGFLRAQIAYDDAGNYVVNGNWTNGANGGFGFEPWVIATNGPDFNGTYVQSANSPTFVIASLTNFLGTNYTDVWGLFANGNDAINETVAYRGFSNSLGTNTFKLQWGSRGAGSTTVSNIGTAHGWCGFALRTGNATNGTGDFDSANGILLYVYFKDGNVPSTLYFWDGNSVQSIPNTSFSDLGRQNITNAIAAEITPGADGSSYHMVLKDCVQNRTIFTTNGIFIGGPTTVDSVALFCQETTGDQVYNRMQIASPTIPPSISNLEPPDGTLYADAAATSLSFEVDSFNSTVSSNAVSVYLNGVLQAGLTFNSAVPTSQLQVSCAGTTLSPDTFYNYTIVAQDANGNIVSNNYTFNTFLPTDIYIDAYDYNYNEGQFVNTNTPVNAYANLAGSNSIDYEIADLTGTNNTAGYRPGDLVEILPLPTDATGDPVDHGNLRANSFTAYNIGFTDTGDWEDYTRVYPAANYSIYARAASVTGGQFEVEKLANAIATTTNQPLIALGRVNVANTGGSKVFTGQLTPVTDFFGNTVVMPLSGTNTLRETALASRVYNLEYFAIVAVPGAGTLRPYIATGSPTPNSTGNLLTTPIAVSIASRQTTVPTNTIQLILNNTNVTSRLVMSSNAAGVTVTWTPTNNLPVNFTNSVVLIFTDSGGVSITNSWTFVTGTSGGILGSGFWSGAGGTNDMFWADGINWTGGTPGPGFNASFANPGATTTLMTNNIVATNVTIQGLFYDTNGIGYHTTWIQDGVTLTVTNGSTGITAAFQAGATTGGDTVFNHPSTNTITGNGGTLLVIGNPYGSAFANQLNFQVRQCASPSVSNAVTLDMSGLGTLIATVGKFYVAQGGSGTAQSNVSGCVFLAKTNVISCLRPNAGQFEVGDSSGGIYELPGSSLYLGKSNAIFVDTVRFGKQKATNNIVQFNPVFTSGFTPALYMRGGTNGPTSRVFYWSIADADTETTVPNFVQANVDLSGGIIDAQVTCMAIGRGETSASDTGSAQGTLTFSGGTLNVNSLTNGCQRANSTATETGIINVNGSATLVSPNILLALSVSGANAALVSGTINVTNGTVRGNINAGGGNSTVNLIGGTLAVSNNVGTPAAPLQTLNLASASLHLKADGNSTATNIVATTVTTSGTTTITIDSVANVNGPTTIHLLGYTGVDPFAGLVLAPLPAAYSGNLVDNPGSVDLSINTNAIVPPPPPPSIKSITISGGQIVISGTNNNGPGGTYKVLTSTNVAVPLSNWAVLTNSSFDGSGNFSSTNAAGTNNQQFYILRVP